MSPSSLESFAKMDAKLEPQGLEIKIKPNENNSFVKQISGHGFKILISFTFDYPGENTTVNSTAIYKLTRYCYIKKLTINATNCNVNGLLNHLEYKQLNFFMLSIGVDSRGEKKRFKRKINRMHMRENVRWLNYHVNIID